MSNRTATRFQLACSTGVCFALLSLTGCLQTLPQPVCPPTAQAAQESIRMMVSFRQALNGKAPETLQQLQAHTGACVTHLSSTSPTLHSYGFSGVSDPVLLVQRLRAWPEVQDVVPDGRARAH